MLVQAIELVQEFTRPIHFITRVLGSQDVHPGTATMFFVNDHGEAITCRHVANLLIETELINKRYTDFSSEKAALPKDKRLGQKIGELKAKYQLKEGVAIQQKYMFPGCFDTLASIDFNLHTTLDLAILKFKGFNSIKYVGNAKFLKDAALIKQGKYLCRLGYPFPEFTNYEYDAAKDVIDWTNAGITGTPRFPIDGIVTRLIKDNVHTCGIEMSTPGLKGQSGGPLFDTAGVVYGMQSMTHHLHLGFDMKDKEIVDGGKKVKVSNHPFLHLGGCVHVDVIKSFLKQHAVAFEEV